MADQIGFIIAAKKADIDTSRYTEGIGDGANTYQSIPPQVIEGKLNSLGRHDSSYRRRRRSKASPKTL